MEQVTIYLQEAEHQVQYAKLCFAAYRAAQAREDIPEIFFHIHHFVVHVANIDKILDPKPSNPRLEILKDRVDLTDIDLKLLRKLRNHLEHFDERLDTWVRNYDGRPFLDMNLVTGTKGFPEKAFLRALDGDVFKFQGESYDLNELYQQLLKIEEHVTSSLDKKRTSPSRARRIKTPD
jgi:hypothetical protein